jgi:hypothetical protein
MRFTGGHPKAQILIREQDSQSVGEQAAVGDKRQSLTVVERILNFAAAPWSAAP